MLLATVGFADESKKYAILIGVNDYDHDKFDALPFAERDVRNCTSCGRIGLRGQIVDRRRGAEQPTIDQHSAILTAVVNPVRKSRE